jgi:hypothetical protein
MVEFFESVVNITILISLEVILGIDNIIFLAILTEGLPRHTKTIVRRIGLGGALILRLVLLFFALILVKWSHPVLFTYWGDLSPHDLFFIFGGGFLIYKSLKEIGNELEFYEPSELQKKRKTQKVKKVLVGIIFQIMIMDLVFSLDSILTAVGLSNSFIVMAIAIVFAIGVMLFASEPVSIFIHRHPSIKMLALAFLVMLGFILFLDGFHYKITREYLYFAMFFSFTVECLNLLYRHRKESRSGK